MNIRTLAAALAACTLLTGSAFAQTPSPATSVPVKKPGLLSRILHRTRTGAPGSPTATATGATTTHSPMMGGSAVLGGNIIGNKNSLVYHMATDHNLPAPKNRVYFKTVAAAEAAGYHAAGTATKTTHAPATHAGRGYKTPTAGVTSH